MTNPTYESSIKIDAPVERVYRYLANLPRHVEWSHQPQEMTPLTEGPARVGSRYQTIEAFPSTMPSEELEVVSEMLPKMMAEHDIPGHTIAEITALVPNQRVAWTAHFPNREGKKMLQMNWALRLQEENGATKVTQHCEMVPPPDSPIAGMFTEEQAEKNKVETAANLARLKSLLEDE